MKAEEMIIKYVVSNGTTTERLNDSDVIILMNDFANQRVIEELEKLLENESNEWVDDEDGNEECGVRIVYSIRLRDRIKELKQ
jgi:hypothetical protein